MKKETEEIAGKIILSTLATVGMLTVIAIAPNSLLMLKLFGFGKRNYKPKSVYRALYRMKQQKLIKIKKDNGTKTTIEITEQGRKRLKKYDLDNLTLEKPKRWGGKWRIVSFDIPEKRKNAREALRNKLRDLEFYALQKSLFVSPSPCQDEIDFIAEVFKVSRNITYFETSKISNEWRLKKHFGI